MIKISVFYILGIYSLENDSRKAAKRFKKKVIKTVCNDRRLPIFNFTFHFVSIDRNTFSICFAFSNRVSCRSMNWPIRITLNYDESANNATCCLNAKTFRSEEYSQTTGSQHLQFNARDNEKEREKMQRRRHFAHATECEKYTIIAVQMTANLTA